MESDELLYPELKKQHLEEWLRRYRTARDIVPDVQANIAMTDWEIDALKNRPTVASEGLPSESYYILKHDYEFTKKAFPLMPEYNPVVASTATAISTSGTANVYDYVAKCADSGVPEVVEYSNKYTRLYHDIQTEQQRPEKVRQLMQLFCSPSTLQRFETARCSYLSAKSAATSPREAALELRNTLDGLKGDLFKTARTTPKENMTWEKMAARLSKGGDGSDEYQEIVRQYPVRSTLIGRLSNILKYRDSGSETNMDDLWTEVLDHIYALLGLLKLPST
jgi:hypothetical protein